jgi:hypothetical protein
MRRDCSNEFQIIVLAIARYVDGNQQPTPDSEAAETERPVEIAERVSQRERPQA